MTAFLKTIGCLFPGERGEQFFDVGLRSSQLPRVPGHGPLFAVIEDNGVAIQEQLPDAPKRINITHLTPDNSEQGLIDPSRSAADGSNRVLARFRLLS